MQKCLEQKQLSSMALVASFKETKAILFKMMSADVLTVQVCFGARVNLQEPIFMKRQEIPKAAERVPGRCHYLWRVDMEYLVRASIGHIFKAMVVHSADALLF